MTKFNIILIFVVALGLSDAALRLDNESELKEARDKLFNVNSKSGWVLLHYVGPSTVHFAASGEGRANEVLPNLEDDQIQYMLIRYEGQEQETSENVVRDVFITWIGPEVGLIEKGRKAAYLGDAQSFLQPYYSDITALSKNNFNDETIIDRSDPLSGSHVID